MTARHFLLLAGAWLCTLCAAARPDGQPTLSELYNQIDRAIGQSPQYVADYEARIGTVRAALLKGGPAENRMMLCEQLFRLYQAYDNDSALAYIARYIGLADSLGRHQQADQGRALMAFQCSTVGLYTESLGILHGIQADSLTVEGKCAYYIACMHVCGELGYYTRIDSMRDYYYRLQDEYRDSLFLVADPHSEEYLLRREQQLMSEKKYEEAMRVNDQRMAMARPDTRDYAIVCYYRHLICTALNRRDEAARWLALSALCDIKNAVMDQASLISLAELLNADGDFDRSYRYISFTWDCNNRFNTRMRSWQIGPILNVIEHSYQQAQRRSSRLLWGSVVFVGIMALLLLALLLYTKRKKKLLATAQQQLSARHDELAALNGQLSAVNTQLSAVNDQLSKANAQLSETNRVKEEYIGRFMSLCSQYIDKLDNYRKMVQKKMKNRELDELFRITKSTELKEKELEELFENFDSVFLHLFPTFVDDFNQLLLPDFQVHPKEEYRLTTDLRIFALIRLGIEDSSKIAEFLHYSVNTIYNYRARTKNGAAGNREHFEQQVKMLGTC